MIFLPFAKTRETGQKRSNKIATHYTTQLGKGKIIGKKASKTAKSPKYRHSAKAGLEKRG